MPTWVFIVFFPTHLFALLFSLLTFNDKSPLLLGLVKLFLPPLLSPSVVFCSVQDLTSPYVMFDRPGKLTQRQQVF